MKWSNLNNYSKIALSFYSLPQEYFFVSLRARNDKKYLKFNIQNYDKIIYPRCGKNTGIH